MSVLHSTHTEKSGRIAPARSRMMGGENSLRTSCVGRGDPRMTNVINYVGKAKWHLTARHSEEQDDEVAVRDLHHGSRTSEMSVGAPL